MLFDAAKEEDLVVHREAEGDGEDEHGLGAVDAAQWSEAEEVGEVAILKYPDERTEADRKGEDVQDHGFDGDHQAAEHQEE